jgi:hypothetical protein
MLALVEWLTIIGTGIFLLSRVLSPDAKNYLTNFIRGLISGALDLTVPLLNELEGDLAPIGSAFVQSLNTHGAGLLNIFRDPASLVARTAFTDVEANLTAIGGGLPEDSPAAAASAIGLAFGNGIASAGVAALYEALIPEKLNTFEAVGPILSKLAGFDEVAAAVREPLYDNAFGRGLDYHYKSIFKPEFAREQDAVLWHARRLLSDTDLREVFKYSGLKAKYEDAFVASAYRSVQPRAIATLVQDTPFPTDQMQALLEFGGFRDQDIALMLPLMEQNSYKNVRSQYLSALINAAERGTIDIPTLDSSLDALNFSAQAKHYVELTVQTRRLEQLAELYRKSVTALYETNQLTDAQYVPALEAIGINEADANAHFAIDSARLKGRQLLAAERAAARLAAQETSYQLKTISAQYLSGQIDDSTMALEVAAAGLPLELVPLVVGYLTARRLSGRVHKYGLLLDRDQAILLTEKVAATKEQVLKKLMPLDAAQQALQSYNLPPANIAALLAEWAAQALKQVLPP